MQVLLLGSGGREHALAAALAASPRLGRLYAAPGNSGTERVATNVALDLADHAAIVAFCRTRRIDLVVVGPEAPLVAGLVDVLEAAGVPAFGPSRAAAQLEGSKGFTKDLCRECGAPTAEYRRCRTHAEALAYVRERGAPIVVKADGLAAGKGVTVAATIEEAQSALDAIFSGAFGDQPDVVLEDVLVGEEASFFALCDGVRAAPFAAAQDHKRAFDGDRGPNTGGMGAYSPAPVFTPDLQARVMTTIIEPALAAMRRRGSPFRGLLFAGLMIGPDGPSLIEFNARFGDPETQAVLPRFQGDLLDALDACAHGRLAPEALAPLSPQSSLTVVLAAGGYPDAPRTGGLVEGLEAAEACEGVVVRHAGMKRVETGLVATGGRVLSVTGLGDTLQAARERAYRAMALIRLPGSFYRRDIGWRALGEGLASDLS